MRLFLEATMHNAQLSHLDKYLFEPLSEEVNEKESKKLNPSKKGG